ncbi:MAG: riboflavin kinase, partial [Actinomycetota bacterium]|nr:riboflavin kinase [Actinomycetota bacterium]
VAPTFERGESRVEAYLLDFEGDLYDKPVRIEFHHRLRDELLFDSVDDLTEQIARDVEETRRLMH